MSDIYLVCEGSDDGLDFKVLNLILVNKLNKAVLISPAGGDTGLNSVANWIEAKSAPGAISYSIEDRNYRSLDTVEGKWKAGSKRFIWRRHEIENYLLEPSVIHQAMISLSQTTPVQSGNLPQTLADVENVMKSAANPLFEDHVGQLTRSQLVEDLNVMRLQLGRPQGQQYFQRQEWLNFLHGECNRLKNSGADLSNLPQFAEMAITELYDRLLNELRTSDFFSGKRYLMEMGGHELMTALHNFLRAKGFPRLSKSDLEIELLKALEQQYAPGYFAFDNQPDDFVELAQRLI
jgi:hypothetical protein